MAKTFELDVEGVGLFVFKHRTIRDTFKIEAEASRMLGGPIDDQSLRAGAAAFATLAVLTVTAPPEWDLEALDPFEPAETASKLLMVHGALRLAEERFRHPGQGDGAGQGAGA